MRCQFLSSPRNSIQFYSMQFYSISRIRTLSVNKYNTVPQEYALATAVIFDGNSLLLLVNKSDVDIQYRVWAICKFITTHCPHSWYTLLVCLEVVSIYIVLASTNSHAETMCHSIAIQGAIFVFC